MDGVDPDGGRYRGRRRQEPSPCPITSPPLVLAWFPAAEATCRGGGGTGGRLPDGSILLTHAGIESGHPGGYDPTTTRSGVPATPRHLGNRSCLSLPPSVILLAKDGRPPPLNSSRAGRLVANGRQSKWWRRADGLMGSTQTSISMSQTLVTSRLKHPLHQIEWLRTNLTAALPVASISGLSLPARSPPGLHLRPISAVTWIHPRPRCSHQQHNTTTH